jgi:hypothetical protein
LSLLQHGVGGRMSIGGAFAKTSREMMINGYASHLATADCRTAGVEAI